MLLGMAATLIDASAKTDPAACLTAAAQPAFAPLNAPPLVHVSREPPQIGGACLDAPARTATWITVAGVVDKLDSSEDVLRRFGAISRLSAARYWSVTDRKWRPLVSAAVAVSAVTPRASRPDYSAAELVLGNTVYYQVTDSRSEHSVMYRLRATVAGPRQVVVETANFDAVRQWGLTLYAPEGLHTLYSLTERDSGQWTYYSVTALVPATFLAEGHTKSLINRAVALYRFYMHLPADTDPPAAP